MSQALLAGISRTTEPRTMLRRFLAVDAVVTGANGLAYLAASGPLGRLLGVDGGLLLELGALLTLLAVGIGLLAGQRQPAAGPVKLVVDANAAWAVLSVVALVAWLEPSAAGTLWIPAQAAVVAALAGLQWFALRAGDAKA
ncbi:hypothetical protein ACFU5O_06000 [Streptomyces sp. NPDC057445]|uniref:hypothetical protein n=1 Tax=Streptomyces sp. NPDC057445 TaxID=3346136 RepID=UPI0036A47213